MGMMGVIPGNLLPYSAAKRDAGTGDPCSAFPQRQRLKACALGGYLGKGSMPMMRLMASR
jgi:hypothetical protein